jgi:glycine/D-amino acid oxidase-like deaminating enzyme
MSSADRSDRTTSLWFDQLVEPVTSRAALAGGASVDVAIVGGGYTGLWAAYSLLVADPAIRVLVIERDTVGVAASGRDRRGRSSPRGARHVDEGAATRRRRW